MSAPYRCEFKLLTRIIDQRDLSTLLQVHDTVGKRGKSEEEMRNPNPVGTVD